MSDKTIKTEILIHDLKVPISVIDAGAKSLLNRQSSYGPLTDKQIKVLKRIIRNTLTSQRLVNDALELGRSREGVMITSDFSVSDLITSVLMEIFDLADPMVTEAIRLTRTYDELATVLGANKVVLSFEPAMWKTVLHLDEAKVRQILRNIVTNAFKHRASLVKISGNLEKNWLVLRVKDDGQGIPPEAHQKIFRTYFTTGSSLENAIQSHGLGLAGVMILLKDMGGELTLHSDDGKGAEFIVRIPL